MGGGWLSLRWVNCAHDARRAGIASHGPYQPAFSCCPASCQAFSSYLLIAWVSTNVIFVAAATILSNSTWETCAMTESEMAVNAVKVRSAELAVLSWHRAKLTVWVFGWVD